MSQNEFDQVLDASGLSCPLPLLKAKQALSRMAIGERLQVIATDAGSVRDFKAYTDQSDHELLQSFSEEGRFIYVIRRG